jgi:uncharacterized delta-60 repeat protein
VSRQPDRLPVLYRPTVRISAVEPQARPSYHLERLEPRILFSGGLVVPQMSGDGFPLILPARGGIYYASSLSDDTGIFLARLTNDGDVDTSFGTAGSLAVGDVGLLVNAVVQPDGKLLAMTDASADGHTSLLMRFDARGRPDPTFGVNGRVTVPGVTDWYGDLAVLDDGRIVIGEASPGTAGQPGKAAIFRFTPDGQLDPGFGDRGVARIECPRSIGYAWDIRVGPDGHVSMIAIDDAWQYEFLVGVDASGAPDPAIGGGHGVVTLSDEQYVLAMYLLHNLRGGNVLYIDGTYLERTLPSGMDDPSFGHDGVATLPITSFASSGWTPLELPDGRLLLPSWGRRSDDRTGPAAFALVALTDNGALDTTFGAGGLAIVPHPADRPVYEASSALDPTGRIVTAFIVSDDSDQLRLMVSRLQPDGTLDASFGSDGSFKTETGVVTAPPPGAPSGIVDPAPVPTSDTPDAPDPAGGPPAAGGPPSTTVFFAGDDRSAPTTVFADGRPDDEVWGPISDGLFGD